MGIFFTCAVTSAAARGSVPKTMPPSLTLGQDILTSKAATPSISNVEANAPYSSAVPAEMFTIRGVVYVLVLAGYVQ